MIDFSSIGDVISKTNDGKRFEFNMTQEEYQQKRVDWYNESEGNLNEIDGYNCDLCKNKGYIARLDNNGNEVHRECKCQKIRATLRRARKSGLGDIITEYTFAKFEATEDWQKQIKQLAQAFCADDKAKWFYIGGAVGSGKSHLCTAIAAHYIKAGKDVKYMIWAEEAKRLKSLVNDLSYQDIISQYKNVDVLYIDDFLKVKYGESPTAADINLAFEIINHRILSRESITIISSEKLLEELVDYDEATMSRIYQKAGKYKIGVTRGSGKNYRMRNMDAVQL